jgi:hypothetical protein
LHRFRLETWARLGLRCCPPERRAEVQEWVSERDAVRDEKAAAREAEQVRAADVYGFDTQAGG